MFGILYESNLYSEYNGVKTRIMWGFVNKYGSKWWILCNISMNTSAQTLFWCFLILIYHIPQNLHILGSRYTLMSEKPTCESIYIKPYGRIFWWKHNSFKPFKTLSKNILPGYCYRQRVHSRKSSNCFSVFLPFFYF